MSRGKVHNHLNEVNAGERRIIISRYFRSQAHHRDSCDHACIATAIGGVNKNKQLDVGLPCLRWPIKSPPFSPP